MAGMDEGGDYPKMPLHPWAESPYKMREDIDALRATLEQLKGETGLMPAVAWLVLALWRRVALLEIEQRHMAAWTGATYISGMHREFKEPADAFIGELGALLRVFRARLEASDDPLGDLEEWNKCFTKLAADSQLPF